VKNGECLILTLICKVARGEEYSNKFDIDFQAIISENRECRIPIQIQAIQLGLSEREATRFQAEYCRLTHLYKLCSVFPYTTVETQDKAHLVSSLDRMHFVLTLNESMISALFNKNGLCCCVISI
jgi:hypothetical protein